MNMINFDARHLLQIEKHKQFKEGVKKFALTVVVLSIVTIAASLAVQHFCTFMPFCSM